MGRYKEGDKMTTEEAGKLYKEMMDRIEAMQPEIPMRDWFAGLAMLGTRANSDRQAVGLSHEEIAALAYAQADAMMKERDK
jgi:hypothetical protein